MTIAGIIAEYNPYHRGHEYHIAETRRITGADYIIVVMSGDYVQRGEPAIVNKYTRAKMALEHGADLVLELPVAYATASAEYFAQAGVKLLDSLGCVDYLSFGSEGATKEQLMLYADLFLQEPEEYRQYLNEALSSGVNFPKAREMAAKSYLGDSYVDILNKSNNILGVEYMKALDRLGSSVEPIVVDRRGAGYLDQQRFRNQEYQSATAIRKYLNDHATYYHHKIKTIDSTEQNEAMSIHADAYQQNLPSSNTALLANVLSPDDITELHVGLPTGSTTEDMLQHYLKDDYVTWDDLMPFLDYNILMKNSVLGKYFGMSLDLERRLKKLHVPGETFASLIERLHSKSMTDTALQRAMLHIVLQMKDRSFLHEAPRLLVPYARVLGFRKESSGLLKLIREQATLDLIQKPVDGKNLYLKKQSPSDRNKEENPRSRYEMEFAAFLYGLDIRSSQLYEQISAAKSGRDPVNEYQRRQIIY